MSLIDHTAETAEQFLDRIHVMFQKEKVFVYPYKVGNGTPVIWTLRQARQYLSHIKQREENEKQELII